ncbi:hypothetical protein WOSG25_070040 [Weissella oryzae SG25]|uniref:Uncharacterized protein n=1 Tax=Weissella oryzae (strain DSM 25784 / JCM 18191 / LMG 30913 / SG25) TaxID=1329250 RepID=A0A069CUE8_WEIOS|nr:TIR domain-containing protein [Weissella oryzae]GAK31027.1 hypothetical protein WOSG25_070040 [Weissella oryzae SG25]
MEISVKNLRDLIKRGEYLEDYGISGRNRNKSQKQTYNFWKTDVVSFSQSLDDSRQYYDFKNKVSILNFYNTFKDILSVTAAMKSLYRKLVFAKFVKVGKFDQYSRNVFIIHGHDAEFVSKVEKVITGLNFKPFDLAEPQDNESRLIEELDRHLETCKGCSCFIYL